MSRFLSISSLCLLFSVIQACCSALPVAHGLSVFLSYLDIPHRKRGRIGRRGKKGMWITRLGGGGDRRGRKRRNGRSKPENDFEY